jgi:hypothetical protein
MASCAREATTSGRDGRMTSKSTTRASSSSTSLRRPPLPQGGSGEVDRPRSRRDPGLGRGCAGRHSSDHGHRPSWRWTRSGRGVLTTATTRARQRPGLLNSWCAGGGTREVVPEIGQHAAEGIGFGLGPDPGRLQASAGLLRAGQRGTGFGQRGLRCGRPRVNLSESGAGRLPALLGITGPLLLVRHTYLVKSAAGMRPVPLARADYSSSPLSWVFHRGPRASAVNALDYVGLPVLDD